MTTMVQTLVTLKCATCRQEFQKPRSRGRYPQRCDACSGRSAPTTIREEHRAKTDPPRRADGKCACGCGKKLKATGEARKYAGVQLDADPFAMSECCRKYYGVVFDADERSNENMRRGGETSAAQHRATHPRSVPGMFAW